MRRILPSVLAVLFLSLAFVVSETQAGPMVFSIDPTQSQLTLSGSIAGYAMTTQAAGSLTTTYSGNINATVSGATIQFTGSSTITAKTNGVWQPAVGGGSGSAPADYGAQASLSIFGTGYGALRNIILDMTSPVLTITGTNFDSSALIFNATPTSGAAFDYHSSVKSGTLALTGYSTNTIANQASLSTNGSVVQLFIKVNTTYYFTLLAANDTPLTLTGQIVANSSLATPKPYINSITATNQTLTLMVTNATTQSLLQVSTNLTSWLPASDTVSNNAGWTIFTTTMSGPKAFFRVQQ